MEEMNSEETGSSKIETESWIEKEKMERKKRRIVRWKNIQKTMEKERRGKDKNQKRRGGMY